MATSISKEAETQPAWLSSGSASQIALVLTVEEAADRLGVGRTVMYALVSSGAVESVRIGRPRRVPADGKPLAHVVASIHSDVATRLDVLLWSSANSAKERSSQMRPKYETKTSNAGVRLVAGQAFRLSVGGGGGI